MLVTVTVVVVVICVFVMEWCGIRLSRLIMMTYSHLPDWNENFVSFFLADTDMESKNLSTEKDGPDAEPTGTRILTPQICL